ncbi:sensor histidine kinase [Trichothermofontia sp.]
MADDHWHLSITNFGVEISPAEQSKIFDRFYRIPHHDPWQQGGTGLGLALIKKLVEYLGGLIHVESGDNRTCFHLTLAKIAAVPPCPSSPVGRNYARLVPS